MHPILRVTEDSERAARRAQQIAVGNGAGSLALLGLLVTVYLRFDSQLALSQAADSFADIFTSVALLVSMRVASQPPDEEHPLGHHRAEPVAALIAAVMAGVLALEVLREAIGGLVGDAAPHLAYPLLGVFGAKIAFKAAVIVLAGRQHRAHGGAALRAVIVDARNDLLVGLSAVGGFFLARYGDSSWDAWLAIPIGLWIGWSGFDLARESIGFLMGEAPPRERREALRAVAEGVSGVRSVHHLVARHHGADLAVLLHVVVDEELTVRAAHDIGHAVERRLLEEPDVVHAVAHVDVDPPADDGAHAVHTKHHPRSAARDD
jgi:ferrous-iron efflux pump FieF